MNGEKERKDFAKRQLVDLLKNVPWVGNVKPINRILTVLAACISEFSP